MQQAFKLGETSRNLFSGSPLNRLSWLRPSHAFLNAVVKSPATRWMLFKAGQPLVATQSEVKRPDLVYLPTQDILPFLGGEPFFGQGESEGQYASVPADAHGEGPLEAVRHRGPRAVFLGLLQPQGVTDALPSSEFTDAVLAVSKLEGTPYFAMDVSEAEDDVIDQVLKATALDVSEGLKLSWSDPRILMSSLDVLHGGIYAEARSLVDWNTRNRFCPACGSPSYSLWGGWKISCSTLLPWSDNSGRKPCPTTKGLHNFTHPRTDPVVIMIAIDESGDKILLGRNRKFPGKFYSALAGFVEPGESFEDAVVREMWEEAGVKVWNVTYHSGQPWPFPANLMVGFYARADSSQTIRIDLDNELQDARWYTRAEISAILNHRSGTYFSSRDYKEIGATQEGRQHVHNESQDAAAAASAHTARTVEKMVPTEPPLDDEPPFKLPPITAIAGLLIRDWATGKIGFAVSEDIPKGHL